MISAVSAWIAEACPSVTDVKTAEDLDLLEKATAASHGSVFVIPYRERAGEAQLTTGLHRQLVAVQFLTAFIVRRHADALGAQRAAEFDGLKAEIEAALAGWEPARGFGPCELVGGEGTPLGNGVSVYVQTWETTRYLQGVQR